MEKQIKELQDVNAVLVKENEALTAEKETLKAENETLKAENETLKTEKEAAQAELVAAKKTVEGVTKEVAGEYESKKHKKTVKFKKGFIFTIINGEKIPSSELIENVDGKYTAELDRLISIGYGGFEEVSK